MSESQTLELVRLASLSRAEAQTAMDRADAAFRDRIRQAHEAGATMRAIADSAGVSPARVHAIVRER